nr:hypothetical protein [uncultured Psychroserpens sp.]
MTNVTHVEPTRTISIYVCSRGFSYAVMDNAVTLIETNLISPKKFGETKLLKKMKQVITSFGDVTLILEDHSSKHNRKGKRSKNLSKKIYRWSKKRGIPVKTYSRDDVREVFSPWMAYTKYDIAQVLVSNIEGLKPFFYEPIKYPERDHNYEAIFTACSLGVTFYFKSGN